MQFAMIGDRRIEATPGVSANCPSCGATMVAKCGPRILHHWAHASQRNCDPWWENETAWHREWKNHFPIECREQVKIAPDGEIHRADVITSTGIVIEVQHSAMTDDERQSREVFYENLVWVVDARSFKNQFELHHFLPDPCTEEADDLVWFKAGRGLHGANSGMFWRRSENPSHNETMVQVHGIRSVKHLIENSRGHRQYTWSKPRRTWLDAQCPVYLDFGGEFLVQLQKYGRTQLDCAFPVSKERFLKGAMSEKYARDIGRDFVPTSSRK